jgi:hypothetical protein
MTLYKLDHLILTLYILLVVKWDSILVLLLYSPGLGERGCRLYGLQLGRHLKAICRIYPKNVCPRQRWTVDEVKIYHSNQRNFLLG